MGRVQVRPAADPPQGANATVLPGLHSSHRSREAPRPQSHIPQAGLGGVGEGAPPPPPSHFSPTFARFPTSIGSVRKLIVYKYPSSARPGTQVEAAGGHQGPPQGRVPDLGPTQGSPLKQLRFSKEKGKMEKETEERKKKNVAEHSSPGWLLGRQVGGWRPEVRGGGGKGPPLSVKCIMRHLHF